MAFNYDFEQLKNEAESLVIGELERQLAARTIPVCTCEECILDMAAYALNIVKPLYRHSILGSQYAAQAMSDPAYGSSVTQAVSLAVEKIRKNPAHE
jgi:competence protein ComFB